MLAEVVRIGFIAEIAGIGKLLIWKTT